MGSEEPPQNHVARDREQARSVVCSLIQRGAAFAVEYKRDAFQRPASPSRGCSQPFEPTPPHLERRLGVLQSRLSVHRDAYGLWHPRGGKLGPLVAADAQPESRGLPKIPRDVDKDMLKPSRSTNGEQRRRRVDEGLVRGWEPEVWKVGLRGWLGKEERFVASASFSNGRAVGCAETFSHSPRTEA